MKITKKWAQRSVCFLIRKQQHRAIAREGSRFSLVTHTHKHTFFFNNFYFVFKRPGYYIFNAYFLIFLITISSLTIFSVDCRLPGNRLQTTYTLLLTSVSFKWVINRSLPTVSYLTSLDQYAIVSISFLCLICFWHSIVGSPWLITDKNQAVEIDKWVLIGFSVLFVIIQIWLCIWFFVANIQVRNLKKKERDFLKQFHGLHAVKKEKDETAYHFMNLVRIQRYV